LVTAPRSPAGLPQQETAESKEANAPFESVGLMFFHCPVMEVSRIAVSH